MTPSLLLCLRELGQNRPLPFTLDVWPTTRGGLTIRWRFPLPGAGYVLDYADTVERN